jgi:hypothetical protein
MSGTTQDKDKKPNEGARMNLKVKSQVYISFSVVDSPRACARERDCSIAC